MNSDEFGWKDKIPQDKISINDAKTEIQVLLEGGRAKDHYDWYFDTRIEENSICVYVTHITKEVMSIIPRVLYGYNVKIAFSSYLTCEEKYGAKTPLVRALSFSDISDDE